MKRTHRRQVGVLAFRFEDHSAVVAEMERIAHQRYGWINLRPDLPPEEEPPPPSGLGALFSVSVHEVPVCTWVPGKLQRDVLEPDSLGIQHSTGTRTVVSLRSLEVPVPEGWRIVQDHPRRGLVVRPPVGTDHGEELTWLLRAATVLSRVPLTGAWLAEVHSRPIDG